MNGWPGIIMRATAKGWLVIELALITPVNKSRHTNKKEKTLITCEPSYNKDKERAHD